MRVEASNRAPVASAAQARDRRRVTPTIGSESGRRLVERRAHICAELVELFQERPDLRGVFGPAEVLVDGLCSAV